VMDHNASKYALLANTKVFEIHQHHVFREHRVKSTWPTHSQNQLFEGAKRLPVFHTRGWRKRMRCHRTKGQGWGRWGKSQIRRLRGDCPEYETENRLMMNNYKRGESQDLKKES
jgi:hypothetical protein